MKHVGAQLWLVLVLASCSGGAGESNTPIPDAAGGGDSGAVSDAAISGVDAAEFDANVGGHGDLCGVDAQGLGCGTGLACCYPCGQPGCEFTCTTACSDGQPGCSDGCFAFP